MVRRRLRRSTAREGSAPEAAKQISDLLLWAHKAAQGQKVAA
jgi:hypothetical protein